MALNNNRELYIKRAKQCLLYGFLLFLLILNIINFCAYISSNSDLIINYQKPDDKLKEFRNPLISTAFVNSSNVLKVLILPHTLPDIEYVKNTKFLKFKKSKIKLLQNELTSEKHFNYMQKYANFVSLAYEIKHEENTVFIWFDNVEKPISGYDKIVSFAKEQHLQPKVFDLLDASEIKNVDFDESNDFAHTLNEQFNNLKEFVSDYKLELKTIIQNDETDDINNYHFNNKASSLIIVCDDLDVCEEFADFSFKKSVILSIKTNLLLANKKYPNQKKQIFLLTKLKEQHFDTEQDFINSLDTSTGVVIKNGLLTGIMAPIYWNKYTTPSEFIKELKIKSGINPDYWSNDIEIYYFKAMEV